MKMLRRPYGPSGSLLRAYGPAIEPSLARVQVALHRAAGDAQGLGDFVVLQPAAFRNLAARLASAFSVPGFRPLYLPSSLAMAMPAA